MKTKINQKVLVTKHLVANSLDVYGGYIPITKGDVITVTIMNKNYIKFKYNDINAYTVNYFSENHFVPYNKFFRRLYGVEE